MPRRWLNYVWRSLVWHRATHLATLAGAATATAVLCGALLIGSSVKSSLRRIALERIGATTHALITPKPVRTSLCADFAPKYKCAPVLRLNAAVTHQDSGARAMGVDVYGVDESFFDFHGVAAPKLQGRTAVLSPPLARELAVRPRQRVVVRLERPAAVPRESLHGRRDGEVRSVSLQTVENTLPAGLSEFTLKQTQSAVRAMFVPMERLGRDLDSPDAANVFLFQSDNDEGLLRRLHEQFRLEDLGYRLIELSNGRGWSFEHESLVLSSSIADEAQSLGRHFGLLVRPFFTYLANSIRIRNRSIPYSLVTGTDAASLSELLGHPVREESGENAIYLNEWAAGDLGAQTGDPVELDYYVWAERGAIETRTAKLRVAGVVSMRGVGADRDVAPTYPGITDQASLTDWDPPFPVDLKRIRPRDEEYWESYRTTPKAWIDLGAARRLWGSKSASLTSLRYAAGEVEPVARALRQSLDPMRSGWTLLPVRESALRSAEGATDFSEYFLYFSFFVFVAALLLVSTFFRLSVEMRQGESGLLKALGFRSSQISSLLIAEGGVVAAAGCVAGAAAGLAYAWLILLGLRTWWAGATGGADLQLEADPGRLLGGALAGFLAACTAIFFTVRRMGSRMAREQVYGPVETSRGAPLWSVALLLGAAVAVVIPSLVGAVGMDAAFFASGAFALTGIVMLASWRLSRSTRPLSTDSRSAFLMALRNASWRPGRSVAVIALVASAAFILASIESFRKAGVSGEASTGGFEIYAESEAALFHDPSTPEGRSALGLDRLPPGMRWTSLRLRPGEDVSCQNLYRPTNPRIVGVPAAFIRENRFRFSSSRALSGETKQNPWLLLETQAAGSAVPAIVDQNSLTYVLHKKLGDVIEFSSPGSEPVRLLVAGTLADSLLQGEIIIHEKDFRRLFPEIEGRRVFLIEGTPSAIPLLEDALADYGFDAQSVDGRLAGFHRVENTYLSTFQALGGLGLLLGLAGTAAILLRNVLERRRELALLRAVGFSSKRISQIVVLENTALAAFGLLSGGLAATLAVLPAVLRRGGALNLLTVLLLLAAGGLVAWVSIRIAASAALRGVLVENLKRD